MSDLSMPIDHPPAVFFDRDGVLNVDTGYTHRLEDCQLIPGAAAAVRMANDAGYKTLVVTNQGGIALGYYTQDMMLAFHDRLTALIQSESGGVIDGLRFCPHHPDAADDALRVCDCRKPSPKMILDLAQNHRIDLAASIMIGDRQTDIEAGQAAGCQSVLFTGGRLDLALSPYISERRRRDEPHR